MNTALSIHINEAGTSPSSSSFGGGGTAEASTEFEFQTLLEIMEAEEEEGQQRQLNAAGYLHYYSCIHFYIIYYIKKNYFIVLSTIKSFLY
jgi:hypothetical protein